MKNGFRPLFFLGLSAATALGVVAYTARETPLEASSHREAPLIADDPVADNTDVYAFRSPDAPETVTIIANYIPMQLPQAGPNYYTFGENVRYEIHIKNNPANTTDDDIIYRFTFTRTNEDPTTFFYARLGKQNLKTTYRLERLQNGGITTLISDGVVPPYNGGPRLIESPVGLNAGPYTTVMTNAIRDLGNGMKVFCGSVDDPFFVDIGGIADLGNIRPAGQARDGLVRKNVHAIAMQIPVSMLQKDGKTAAQATNILDPDFVIGVWASASRPALRTLNTNGTQSFSGNFVQVSRLGMPLTNEAIIPIGNKDEFNARTPYNENRAFDEYFVNPELGLYMADNAPVAPVAPKPAGQTYFGEAVPGFNRPGASLRIQSRSLAGVAGLPANGFDFRNGANGLSVLTAAQRAGTVFANATFGPILLQAGKPRSVDLLPIFMTGVPNLPPYQLATGKGGNPLAAGKPFINNFLPTLGDMLRLNMAVPPTPRTSPDFSNMGLLQAAVLGLTDARFNANATLQTIPNMDGFPNGRRLEDDVERIELQAVGGVVLAAIGLPYDDFTPGGSLATPRLLSVLAYNDGVSANDTTLRTAFPYVQTPWSGIKAQTTVTSQRGTSGMGLKPQVLQAQVFPNPFKDAATIRCEVAVRTNVTVTVVDMLGREIATPVRNKQLLPGTHDLKWKAPTLAAGQYVVNIRSGSTTLQSINVVHND